MRLAYFAGSTGDGDAAIYRAGAPALLRAFASLGYDVSTYLPAGTGALQPVPFGIGDAVRLVAYPSSREFEARIALKAHEADVVMVADDGVAADPHLRDAVFACSARDALRIWWDPNAGRTVSALMADHGHTLRITLADADIVMTRQAQDAGIAEAYRRLGVATCLLSRDTDHPGAAIREAHRLDRVFEHHWYRKVRVEAAE